MNQAELKRIAHYNPATGVFTRRTSTQGKLAGEVMGHTKHKRDRPGRRPYKNITVSNKRYTAHRLAWLYMTGVFPPDQIDHINHDGLDNRWENLRVVNNQENHKNQSLMSHNTSGFCGVYWHQRDQTWCAHIEVDGKAKALGRSKCKIEAVAIRMRANREYGFHKNHGNGVY